MIAPRVYAHQYLALDRSHYIPGIRVSVPESIKSEREGRSSGVEGIQIDKDGFRADPRTGQGNPERCSHVLIGDSMIYGAGLPYSESLRPVLVAMGIDACVFGVPGNTAIDYLATLSYVAKRIDNQAHVAIYLYAYNDFVSLHKYFRRWLAAKSSSFRWLSQLIVYFDNWRRTTFTHQWFRRKSRMAQPSLQLWQLKIGETKTVQFYHAHDPRRYVPPKPLSKQQRASLKLFFRRLHEIIRDHSWSVSIVIIPDNSEVMANIARGSTIFHGLDQRRIDALEICRGLSSSCEELAPYFYKRMVEEGTWPYLVGDRHFSAFGTGVVAEHYLAISKRGLKSSMIG